MRVAGWCLDELVIHATVATGDASEDAISGNVIPSGRRIHETLLTCGLHLGSAVQHAGDFTVAVASEGGLDRHQASTPSG